MYGAVVELDALADAYRPAAQHQRLVDGGGDRLVLLFVGAVEVGRLSLELRRTGIHHLIDRADVPFLPGLAYLVRCAVRKYRDLLIAESESLGHPQKLWRQRFVDQPALHPGYPVECSREPRVYARSARQFFRRYVPAQCGHECPQPLVVGVYRQVIQDVFLGPIPAVVLPQQ